MNKRSLEELKSFADHIDAVLRTHPGIRQAEPDMVAHAAKARELALAKYERLSEHPKLQPDA